MALFVPTQIAVVATVLPALPTACGAVHAGDCSPRPLASATLVSAYAFLRDTTKTTRVRGSSVVTMVQSWLCSPVVACADLANHAAAPSSYYDMHPLFCRGKPSNSVASVGLNNMPVLNVGLLLADGTAAASCALTGLGLLLVAGVVLPALLCYACDSRQRQL